MSAYRFQSIFECDGSQFLTIAESPFAYLRHTARQRHRCQVGAVHERLVDDRYHIVGLTLMCHHRGYDDVSGIIVVCHVSYPSGSPFGD